MYTKAISGKVSTGPAASRVESWPLRCPFESRRMSRNASRPNSARSMCLTIKQHSAFLFQRGEQFVQRMREGSDAIGQQFFCDQPQVVHSFSGCIPPPRVLRRSAAP